MELKQETFKGKVIVFKESFIHDVKNQVKKMYIDAFVDGKWIARGYNKSNALKNARDAMR